jgi:alanine racemase
MGSLIEKIFQYLRSPRVDYQPLIEVRIFRDAILHNLKTFQSAHPRVAFAPVLKSNAYGHGLVEVATILDNKDLPFFMVDSFYEALVLRRAGIKTKILVLGYCRQEQLLKNSLDDISFGIIDLEILKSLSRVLQKPLNIHLKIDTGMHRQGILLSEVSEAINLIKTNNNITLEGICTHFADSDGKDKAFTNEQILTWNNQVKIFKQSFPNIKYTHASNTAGAYYANNIDANVSRLGIGLFGVNTSTFEKLPLLPALEMNSIVSSRKEILEGEKVGYGITFESKSSMVIATVPIGYNEGVDRRLSNKGSYKIKNVYCPLIGRVSMNISTIDVTNVLNVLVEDKVTIISNNREDKNSVENMAKMCDCIPYEILVHIPQHLRRIIV